MNHIKEMKNNVGTFPKSNIKILERGKVGAYNTQIHSCSLSCLGTDTPIINGYVNLVISLPPLSEMIRHGNIFKITITDISISHISLLYCK
jgi:hypothetical protein